MGDQVTDSYPKETFINPNVTYSYPMVRLIYSYPKVTYCDHCDPKVTFSYPKVTCSDPKNSSSDP